MLPLIYFLVGLLATTFGAAAGLGGGIIIKPVLDLLGQYDVATISILSSFTVFSMAIVSTLKQIKSGAKFQGSNTLILSIGSIIGGILGKEMFVFFINTLANENLAKSIQACLLTILLIFVYLYMSFKSKLPKLCVENGLFIFIIGLALGIIAAFLGIGGGPINVAILTIFFSMEAKTAAIHSVLIILFSQLSKLMSVGLSTGFSSFDLTMLIFMIPGGIIGGFVGAKLNRLFKNETVSKIFKLVLILIIFLSSYNALINLLSFYRV